MSVDWDVLVLNVMKPADEIERLTSALDGVRRCTNYHECDCAAKAPTVPVFRDTRDHLPDCNLRRTAYAMIRTISVSLNMRPEVTP